MGFWDTHLGAPAQQPAAPATAAPAVQQGPWWAQATYAPPATTQTIAPPVHPSQPQTEQPSDPGTWGTVEGSTRRAKSARLDERCPDCQSTNIFKPDGMPNYMPQCYECGYNPRFAQSTAGAGLPGGDAAGPATPARQVGGGGGRGGVSNYHPETVIGRATA